MPNGRQQTRGFTMSQFNGWVIDRDYINVGSDAQHSRVGIGETATSFHRGVAVAEVSNPVRFRVLDDDGEVYYGGAISRAWIDGEEELAFSPLAWAMGDAGATELQYHYGDGAWRTL